MKKLPKLTNKTPSTPSTRADRARSLRQQLPVATGPGSHGRGEGKPFQVVLPAATVLDLKRKALERDLPVRALVLEALAQAGVEVPPGEVADRRRS